MGQFRLPRTPAHVSCVLVGLFLGCQTYRFEPADPFTFGQTTQSTIVTAVPFKPNMMFLVDNSGSMSKSLVEGCTTCPKRITALQSAMREVLSADAGLAARFGLTIFPSSGDTCAPANGSSVAVPLLAPTQSDEGTEAALKTQANSIIRAVDALAPNGGTPTAASLEFVGTMPGLNDDTDFRSDYVVLLTDGLPNCDPTNAVNLCASQSAEALAACNCQADHPETGCLPAGGYCAKGCVDRSWVLEAIAALKRQHIITAVVGFGSGLTGSLSAELLEAMGTAGSFPRKCKVTTDCGPMDTCLDNGRCRRHFYEAHDGPELAAAIQAIAAPLGDPCVHTLSVQPNDPRLISVRLDGEYIAPGPDTWSYKDGEVVFTGPTCQRLSASNSAHPIEVEFRIVETL